MTETLGTRPCAKCGKANMSSGCILYLNWDALKDRLDPRGPFRLFEINHRIRLAIMTEHFGAFAIPASSWIDYRLHHHDYFSPSGQLVCAVCFFGWILEAVKHDRTDEKYRAWFTPDLYSFRLKTMLGVAGAAQLVELVQRQIAFPSSDLEHHVRGIFEKAFAVNGASRKSFALQSLDALRFVLRDSEQGNRIRSRLRAALAEMVAKHGRVGVAFDELLQECFAYLRYLGHSNDGAFRRLATALAFHFEFAGDIRVWRKAIEARSVSETLKRFTNRIELRIKRIGWKQLPSS